MGNEIIFYLIGVLVVIVTTLTIKLLIKNATKKAVDIVIESFDTTKAHKMFMRLGYKREYKGDEITYKLKIEDFADKHILFPLNNDFYIVYLVYYKNQGGTFSEYRISHDEQKAIQQQLKELKRRN